MQAITTKYLGWTDTRPARIKATAQAGSITISVDSIPEQKPGWMEDENRHRYAARLLMKKYGWKGRIYGGTLPNSRGVQVWVMA